MSWLLELLAGWVAVAAVLGVSIGAAIRVADRRAAPAPATTVPEPPDSVDVPPAVPGTPWVDGRVPGAFPPGEPTRPRMPQRDSGLPPARRVDDARPVIVRQRQVH